MSDPTLYLVWLPTKSIIVSADDLLAIARDSPNPSIRVAAKFTWFVTVSTVAEGVTSMSRRAARLRLNANAE